MPISTARIRWGSVSIRSPRRTASAGARRAYLERNMSRPNLKVVTGAPARKILFDGTRAIGVEYSRDGKPESVRAKAEVIVSSGAFQSPQLLMLSGIGNAADLKGLR